MRRFSFARSDFGARRSRQDSWLGEQGQITIVHGESEDRFVQADFLPRGGLKIGTTNGSDLTFNNGVKVDDTGQ